MANGEALLFGFDVNVAGPGRDAVGEKLVDETHHRWQRVGTGRGRGALTGLVLLLAEHLDVEQPLRLASRLLAAVDLVDALGDRVARRKLELNIPAGGESESVLAFDIVRVG